jgi:hypothetical protein
MPTSKHAKLNEVEPAPPPPLWTAKLVYFDPVTNFDPLTYFEPFTLRVLDCQAFCE